MVVLGVSAYLFVNLGCSLFLKSCVKIILLLPLSCSKKAKKGVPGNEVDCWV